MQKLQLIMIASGLLPVLFVLLPVQGKQVLKKKLKDIFT